MEQFPDITGVTTLDGLFRSRVARTPQAVAYHQFDAARGDWRAWRWAEVAGQVAHWRCALQRHALEPGERVAVMAANSVEWVIFDQAALALGLVTVPLFSEDNAHNCAHILRDAGVRVAVVGNARQLAKITSVLDSLPVLERVVCIADLADADKGGRVTDLRGWLSRHDQRATPAADDRAGGHTGGDLATIVYTSGTTGVPKGVMLTHANILKNAQASDQVADVGAGDMLVSFLPLSHMFERTAGYYLTMLVGAEVAFARSVATLIEDIARFRPTVLISVPRIYEQVFARLEAKLRRSPLSYALFGAAVAVGRRRADSLLRKVLWPVFDRAVAVRIRGLFGGRLRYAISGGAPMPPAIAHALLALGVPVCQGYGLTETSPVLSVNLPDDNVPESVGMPLPGVEVAVGDDGELLTCGEYVMRGYWNRPDATRRAIDNAGWFHTGDKARIDDAGRLYIVGRIKEIIVMANGEKVPPADLEQALLADPLISQVMVYGEGRPFLIACVVADSERMRAYKDPESAAAGLRRRSTKLLERFPAYARVRRFVFVGEPWSVDNGLLTPTLKMRRALIAERCRDRIEEVYRAFR